MRLASGATAQEQANHTAPHGFSGIATLLDRAAPALVAALVVGYCGLFTAMSIYWRDNLRWGFDILVYSQPIWNTAHGRLWEVSIYNWTGTELGHDVVLIELALAPLYRLVGSNLALIIVQSAAIALGGWGAYAVGRNALPKANRIVPFLGALLYLSLLFVHRTNLDEFKSRNLVMFAWFFAWLGYRTNRVWLYWAMLALALLTRSDVALVVVAFGVYGLIERRTWTQSWLPIAVGAMWFFAVVYVIVPHYSTAGFVYDENYGWLGGSLSGIVRATFTRPWYVIQGVLTPDKLRYTFDLLFPFAFLPLLRPKILLIPLPIYLLNMLSAYENQYSIVHHYQALIVPWLAIAAIEAIGDLAARRGVIVPRLPHRWGTMTGTAVAATLTVAMLVCSSVQQLTVNSPILSYIAHHTVSSRGVAGRALIAQVPRDAPLAITQKLAGDMPDRRFVYSFPGDPLYHSPALVDRADYLIGDTELSTFEQDAIARYRANPTWRVVDERGGFILMQRVGKQ